MFRVPNKMDLATLKLPCDMIMKFFSEEQLDYIFDGINVTVSQSGADFLAIEVKNRLLQCLRNKPPEIEPSYDQIHEHNSC